MYNPYNPRQIEAKWTRVWEEEKTFHVDLLTAKKPFYNLLMFPYPSAEGLHVGHIIPYSGGDTYARFIRMNGFDVFEPMGFDAFGIHSENYAIKVAKHPRQLIAETTNYFREKQMKRLGTLFDWSRQVDTTSSNYYKWTQWLFIKMFKAGLAVKKKAPVNWCPSCRTVLADEQVEKSTQMVTDGRQITTDTGVGAGNVCERCKTAVEKKEMEQWFFLITKYAEKLLNGLKHINWTEKTKLAQKNWIGRKEGMEIKFAVKREMTPKHPSTRFARSGQARNHAETVIRVFTTRVDTIFGATFVVLAPENQLIKQLPIPKDRIKIIEQYIKKSQKKSEQERLTMERLKTGVDTGCFCINPLTNEKIPIWVADYVLMGYGTGAIMGVPAHDSRDYDFAKKYGLKIKMVVKPDNQARTSPNQARTSLATTVDGNDVYRATTDDGNGNGYDVAQEPFAGEGVLVNSAEYTGLTTKQAMQKITQYIKKHQMGRKKVTYKLRDWCISRQRYWGPPIPMIYCSSCAREGMSWFTSSEDQKSKIPNSKFQIPNKSQNPNNQNSKQDKNHSGGFEHSNFEFRVFAPPAGGAAGLFPVPEKDLPVLLPETDDYLPDGSGKSPLARMPKFVKAKCPNCGGEAERETDVSDTFLDSSWYFLRYLTPRLESAPFASARFHGCEKKDEEGELVSKDAVNRWLPVDMYIGGHEHACLHLLYARFVTMVLHDLGYLKFAEPFKRFYAHGLMIKNGAKMSKSRGNVVNPNIYLDKYGADTLRLYIMFLGPFDQGGDFRDAGIAGMHRWLGRVWKLVTEKQNPKSQIPNPKQIQNSKFKIQNDYLERLRHRTIKKVTDDLSQLKFNTAIAALMEYTNELARMTRINNSADDADTVGKDGQYRQCLETLLLLLAPMAPFITEELWQRTQIITDGRQIDTDIVPDNYQSIHNQPWPKYDERLIKEETVTMVIQIDGRTRDKMTMSVEKVMDKVEVEKLILGRERVKRFLAGRRVRKTVLVRGRLLNFVTRN